MKEVVPSTSGTHRQEDVARIHQDEDNIASRGEMEGVRADEEHDGDDVVREHLPVVFSPLLDVDDENLLARKGTLNKVVCLGSQEKRPSQSLRPVRRPNRRLTLTFVRPESSLYGHCAHIAPSFIQ